MPNSQLKKIQSKYKATQAMWALLDTTESLVLEQPQISNILITGLGSIDKAIKFLRQSDSKDAQAVLRKWDAASKKAQKQLPFEAFCISAGVKTKALVGLIMSIVVEHGSQASEMMLAAAAPEIVKSTIKRAKTSEGIDEKRIVLQNRGIMATPKNNVFNNFGQVDNRKQIANVSVSQLEKDNDKIGEAVDSFNTQNMLKAGNEPEPIIVDVVDEE